MNCGFIFRATKQKQKQTNECSYNTGATSCSKTACVSILQKKQSYPWQDTQRVPHMLLDNASRVLCPEQNAIQTEVVVTVSVTRH